MIAVSETQDEVMTRHERHNLSDRGRQAAAVYQRLRPTIETEENMGKIIIVDPDTGDYEISKDEMGIQATHRLQERHPDSRLFGLRIGYKTVDSFCGEPERLPDAPFAR